MKKFKIDKLGKHLLVKREQRGYSQEELGELSGIANTMICRFEKGRSRPNIENLVRLAEALNCTTDYLLGAK